MKLVIFSALYTLADCESKSNKDLSGQNFYIQNTADQNCVQNHCDHECHSESLEWYNTKPECINCIRFNACLKSGWLKKDEFHKCGKTRCKDRCVRDWNSENCAVCMSESCVTHETDYVKTSLETCGRKCSYTEECEDSKTENSVCFSDCQLECHSTRSSAIATVKTFICWFMFITGNLWQVGLG